MDINAPLSLGPLQSTAPELLAVIAGLLSVWFMKKEKVIAYPVGILNVLIYVYIFFQNRLYANAAINGYFFLMSVYGWYNWSRKTDSGHAVRISRCSLPELAGSAVAVLLLFFLIREILIRYTESQIPSWDAGTTAVYMVAQYLVSRKKIENWFLWISADFVMTVVCFIQGLVFTSLQYAVFTIIAILAYMEWKKKLTP